VTLAREVHYLRSTDPDFEGVIALCDHVAGLTEDPRRATLASAIVEEVTCPACLRALWYDGVRKALDEIHHKREGCSDA
jgi:hypothetical protein